MQNNYYQLIGLLIIVGFSVISWVFRKLNEEATKKRAKDAIEDRRREMLRTGRDPAELQPAPQTSAESQRQRELATRRESQLAELRRRAHARQQAGEASARQAPGPAPITRIPGSAGPTVPQRRSPMGPALKQRPAPQARPAQRPLKPQKPMRAPPVMVATEPEETTHRLVADDAPPPARRVSPIVSGAPQSPEEWRRAIIANEILSPPLAMRTGEVPLPF